MHDSTVISTIIDNTISGLQDISYTKSLGLKMEKVGCDARTGLEIRFPQQLSDLRKIT